MSLGIANGKVLHLTKFDDQVDKGFRLDYSTRKQKRVIIAVVVDNVPLETVGEYTANDAINALERLGFKLAEEE